VQCGYVPLCDIVTWPDGQAVDTGPGLSTAMFCWTYTGHWGLSVCLSVSLAVSEL
jgi:hypothetical protein